MTIGPWSLTPEQRAETVSRIRANMASMAFFRGTPMSEDTLTEESKRLEAKAYAAAQVSGTVTTGHRPHEETLQGYISKLSQLVLDTVASAASERQPAQAVSSASAHSLDLTGQREFLTAETARDAMRPLFLDESRISHVKLSTKSFGVEAAEVAAEAILRVADSLTHADLADIIAGRPEEEALRALRIMADALSQARLVDLDLSDNALGEKGVRAASAAFVSQEGLERLAFRNVGCSVHACAALDELLPAPATLRALSLYNNMSGDEGAGHIARLLARATAIEEFSMVSSRVGPEGGEAILRALAPRAESLVALDLHDNPITEEAAPALLELLAKAKSLRLLNLTDTGLGDDAVAEVCTVIETAAPPLEELHLALNEATPATAEALAAALSKLPSLKVLDLRENELEDEGLKILAHALSALPELERVDVSGNQATREGILAIVQALSAAKKLSFLGIDENELSNKTIELVKAILEKRGQDGVLGPLDNNLDVSDEEDEGDVADLLEQLKI